MKRFTRGSTLKCNRAHFIHSVSDFTSFACRVLSHGAHNDFTACLCLSRKQRIESTTFRAIFSRNQQNEKIRKIYYKDICTAKLLNFRTKASVYFFFLIFGLYFPINKSTTYDDRRRILSSVTFPVQFENIIKYQWNEWTWDCLSNVKCFKRMCPLSWSSMLYFPQLLDSIYRLWKLEAI